MALDLLVRKQTDFRTDEFGRNVWTVIELGNLRNCWNTYYQLSDRLENGFTNCATHTFYGKTFHEILETLQEQLTKLTELSKTKEINGYQRRVLKHKIEALSFEVDKLENFIAANDIPNDGSQDYQVHAWY